MSKLLLVETASPKRVCHKLEQILEGTTAPEITLLCREDNRAAYSDYAGISVYSFAGPNGDQIPSQIANKNFDILYVFWTGEKRYRRAKLLALRLRAGERYVMGGDGNEFRLTWKAACRHTLFRWKHPLPTDHWDFVLPKTLESKEESAVGKPKVFQGERVLILQTAEPHFVRRALDRLKDKPIFRNPRYTLFCRNKPEIVDSFRSHPMLFHLRIHNEASGSWKHLRELRRSGFDAVILFLTGDPSYWKLKLFAVLLGVPLRRMLIFNEGIDCFFFNWSQWFELVLQRMQSRPIPGAGSKWTHSARILVSLLLKSVMLPFRFLWLLLVWLRLRSAGLRYSKKRNDDSSRLPILPGI